MKRIIAALAAVVAVAATVPVSAAAAVPTTPVVPAGSVINPAGKVVQELPPLDTVRVQRRLPSEVGPVKGLPSPSPEKARVSALADEECTESEYGACYFYNGGWQADFTPNYGASANVKIGGHAGALNGATDHHTLVEEAVQSADSQQVIEVGVTQDPKVNKNPPGGTTGWYGPRAFVGAWVNGVFQGYNGGGFVPVSGSAIVPGVTDLTANTTYAFHIWYNAVQDKWWIGLGTSWLGYYPGSLWSGASTPVTFDRAGLIQIFWELASTELRPCSDLGNGLIASNANASRVSNIAFRDVDNVAYTTDVNFSTFRSPTVEAGTPYGGTYSEGPAGAQRAYRGGGPMWNAAGTGVGSLGQPC